MSKNIENEVKEIIKEWFSVNENKITLDAHLVNNLGADSLTLIDLVVSVEKKYNIRISEEDREKIQTYGDIVNYISRYTQEQ
jgi:acyl carrier protein